MTSFTNKNRLAKETSPYLRQHATNPVEWYPWGEESLEKARAEDKPIFLSVGYSSCHWCHVMAHESFENRDVAERMNKSFICIKIDREENPDIDALYMTATQLMTQRGGWPNSVWLTPDGRPWYAGTYFPREDSPGRIGFMSLLDRLAVLWKERRKDVEEQANILTEAIRHQHQSKPYDAAPPFSAEHLTRLVHEHYRSQFDSCYGGFGDAPKFPPHSGLLLLLRAFRMAPNPELESIIRNTLDAMMRGGIYDQIGGGFHRYSTDEKWLLPHFEKMLYDNALLLKVYALAADIFKEPSYRRVVFDTVEWLHREMTHPEGGFYSALDADSEGEEGKYYTWTLDELKKLLDPPTLARFSDRYNMVPSGNFKDEATRKTTGLNIPHLHPTSKEEDVQQLSDAVKLLLTHRNQRVHPGLDNKIIAGWNGLMISALAVAGRCLHHPPFIEAACRARSFVTNYLTSNERLARCWCGQASPQEGALDDYAALALADIDLYEATGQQIHIKHAVAGVTYILANFYNPDTGDLFMTSSNHVTPLIRLKDVYDQGSPAGVGLATQALVRLGTLQNNREMIDTAHKICVQHRPIIQRAPSAVASLIEGLLFDPEFICEQPVTSEVFFTFRPATLNFNRDGTAISELAVVLPDGWHLNETFPDDGGSRIPLELALTGDPSFVDVLLEQTEPSNWRVRFRLRPNTPIKPVALSFSISCQPCTERECLPARKYDFVLPVEYAS